MRALLYRWRAISYSANPEELNDVFLVKRVQYLLFLAGLIAVLIAAAAALWWNGWALLSLPARPKCDYSQTEVAMRSVVSHPKPIIMLQPMETRLESSTSPSCEDCGSIIAGVSRMATRP